MTSLLAAICLAEKVIVKCFFSKNKNSIIVRIKHVTSCHKNAALPTRSQYSFDVNATLDGTVLGISMILCTF